MRLLLLGDLRVVPPTGPVWEDWPTRKAGELAARLAVVPGRSCARDEVAAALWPDADTATARNRLKQTVSLLRRALGDASPLLAPAEDRSRLGLVPLTTDADEFAAALRQADRAAASEAALEHLEPALSLWRGPFLGAWQNDWINHERDRWNRLYRSALLRAVQAYEFVERYDAALERAQTAHAFDPLDEDAAQAVMRLLARTGRKAAAVRTFQEFDRRFRQQLAMEPSAETRELARSLRRETAPPPPAKPGSLSLPAVPVDREQDDAARLLGMLRRQGIAGVGEGSDGGAFRPELLGALAQVAGALTGPERDALRRQHTAGLVRRVEASRPHWRGPDAERHLSGLDAAQSEVTAALRFLKDARPADALGLATRLHWWWYTRGRYAEGRQVLESLLQRTPDERSKMRADALLAAGHFANCLGDNRAAFARYREARSIAEHLGDNETVALSRMREGNAAMEEGLFVPGQALCYQAADYFRARGDEPNLLMAQFYLYQVTAITENLEKAEGQARDTLCLARSLGDRRYEALLLRGDAQHELIYNRDVHAGARATARALSLLSIRPDVMTAIYVLEGQANLLAMRQQADEAATVLGIAAGLRERSRLWTPTWEKARPEHFHVPESLALQQPGIRRAARTRGRELSVSLPESLALARDILGE